MKNTVLKAYIFALMGALIVVQNPAHAGMLDWARSAWNFLTQTISNTHAAKRLQTVLQHLTSQPVETRTQQQKKVDPSRLNNTVNHLAPQAACAAFESAVQTTELPVNQIEPTPCTAPMRTANTRAVARLNTVLGHLVPSALVRC